MRFLLDGVCFLFFILGDVVRTYVFFFFSSFIDTLFLRCDSKPCTYDVIYI